jgi:hypothetical protein
MTVKPKRKQPAAVMVAATSRLAVEPFRSRQATVLIIMRITVTVAVVYA